MSCEKYSNELLAYLDQRAGAEETRALEAHMKVCSGCRERAAEFRRLWNVMAEAPAIEPSLSFDARLRQRIAAEPRRNRWSWLLPAPRLSLAVAALAALMVWVGSRPQKPVNPQSATANSEEQFRMINDLGVLENYDVLSNFDALSELPSLQKTSDQTQGQVPAKTAPGTGGGQGES